MVGPGYELIVLDDGLSHPTDPANRVLVDFHGKRIRPSAGCGDLGMWPDRERLGSESSCD